MSRASLMLLATLALAAAGAPACKETAQDPEPGQAEAEPKPRSLPERVQERTEALAKLPPRGPVFDPSGVSCPDKAPLLARWPEVTELLGDAPDESLRGLQDVSWGSPPAGPAASLVQQADPLAEAMKTQASCQVRRFILRTDRGSTTEPEAVLSALRLAKLLTAHAVARGSEGAPEERARRWLASAVLGADVAQRAGLLGATTASAIWKQWAESTLSRAQPLLRSVDTRHALRAYLDRLIAVAPAPADLLMAEATATAAGVVATTHGAERNGETPAEDLAPWTGWLPDEERTMLREVGEEAAEIAVSTYLSATNERAGTLRDAKSLAEATAATRSWANEQRPNHGPLADITTPEHASRHIGRYVEALARLKGASLLLAKLTDACAMNDGTTTRGESEGVEAVWTRQNEQLTAGARLNGKELLARELSRADICPR